MRLLPNEFFEELVKNYGLQRNNSVYTDRVVLYLMVSQRLRANGTLQTGVNQLIRGLPQDFWPRPCKRLSTEGLQRPMSSNTGSYNKGRQRLPVIIVEACYDRIYKRLIEQTESLVAGKGRRGYLLDGTTLRTPHTATLKETYPPASNQHGESHWPLLRMVVAHDLHTGLAMRPQWGSQAVSEQKLLEQCIDRIPAEGILVADANFGVFSVAYAAHVRRRAMVLRLERNRAQRICPEPLRDGLQVPICWKPSRAECKKHHLPADAGVPGWIVVRQIRRKPDGKPFLLLLFTTVD
jgi:hypothetical protein